MSKLPDFGGLRCFRQGGRDPILCRGGARAGAVQGAVSRREPAGGQARTRLFNAPRGGWRLTDAGRLLSAPARRSWRSGGAENETLSQSVSPRGWCGWRRRCRSGCWRSPR